MKKIYNQLRLIECRFYLKDTYLIVKPFFFWNEIEDSWSTYFNTYHTHICFIHNNINVICILATYNTTTTTTKNGTQTHSVDK